MISLNKDDEVAIQINMNIKENNKPKALPSTQTKLSIEPQAQPFPTPKFKSNPTAEQRDEYINEILKFFKSSPNVDDKLKALKENLPNQKESIAFIGDGLNDAPVIASADIGIAIGSGASDATIAISDVVIMNENLRKVEELIYIAKKTKQKVIQNIVFCLVIKVIIMVLNLIPAIEVPVWLAIFSDVGVSLIAIANSMIALGRFKREEKKLKKQKSQQDEEE
jgi:hypothetical protein